MTVASPETARVNETHADLQATVELVTRFVEEVPYYGGQPVRLGREIGVATDDYEFDGEVVASG